MKTTIKFFAAIAIVVSLLAGKSSFAQQASNVKEENGYFVLINTKEEKKITTVRFYNNENVMIYEEKVSGVKFNLKRKKTVEMLYKGLDKAVIAWNKKPETLKDKDWMKAIAKNK